MTDTGGFSTSDAVLTAAMSGGLGGRGGGQWGGGYHGDVFADAGSNAVRINRNADVAAANERCTKETLGAALDRISSQNFEGRFNDAITSIKDGQFRAELRTCDELKALHAEMNENARRSAECCCDLKLEGCKNTAMLSAEIKAAEARGIERDRNLLQSELIALRTQVACGCTTGCSTPCAPPA